MRTFQDGSADIEQVSKTLLKIQTSSEMPVDGAIRIGQNKTDINGQKVAMVVLAWSPNSASFANFLKQQMDRTATLGGSGHRNYRARRIRHTCAHTRTWRGPLLSPVIPPPAICENRHERHRILSREATLGRSGSGLPAERFPWHSGG